MDLLETCLSKVGGATLYRLKAGIENHCYGYAKQKHLGCKISVRPIRSIITNRQVQSKTVISAEAKKLLYLKFALYMCVCGILLCRPVTFQ